MFSLLLSAVLASSASPRERTRFDDGWKFQSRPVLTGEARLGPFRWEWRLAEGNSFDTKILPDDLDSGDWIPTRVGTSVLQRRQNGWFRTDLGDDPEGHEKVIHFDSTDEDAAVFLNGQHIGTHLGFGTEFEFPVAKAWRKGGPNRLVVLVKNWAQTGGINGGVTLVRPENEPNPPEAAPDLDDSGWRSVHLPHDYVIEGNFDPDGDNSHGSLPKPLGFYRKTFVPSPRHRGKRVWLEFDGVYRNADVFLNGRAIGHQDSGYAGFRVDLGPHLRWGEPNVLAVRVDPRKNEGWWYEGGGIYRHVWLNVADPVHIAPDGVFARSKIRKSGTTAMVRVEVENATGVPATRTVEVQLFDPKGTPVGTATVPNVAVPTGGTQVETRIEVPNPQRWDLDQPNLYRVEARLCTADRVRDAVTTHFGIREIRWDADRGFFLNGRPVKLKGTSNHQDHAGVGIALSDRLIEWRLRLLKSMGSNAYRTAHNPVARELLEVCDRIGMLVLDETRHLGDTTSSKSAPGTTAENLADLKFQVRRDRNHPSVIAWSLYNEEPLQSTPEGVRIFRKMRAVANALDGTRLCTGATNDGFEGGVIDATELFGINYNIGSYDHVRARNPKLPLFGSETGSAVSTRGVYVTDPKLSYVSAFDVNKASFGNTAEEAWKAVASRDWMAGCFVWTGFDYKGEPTPYGWPAINSAFGIIDIAGFPKDTFWYYQAWWSDRPVVHLLPHWNWDGGSVRVWVHSNADEVELSLNGRSLGRKPVPKWEHAEWDVPYAPGTLLAKGYRNGKVIAQDRVETTGPAAGIRLKTDWPSLLADGEDTALIQVEVVDAEGRTVPTAAHRIQFTVEGPAAIAGVGNGDPTDHDPDRASNRRAFGGRCMVLVRSDGSSGKVRLRATADGLLLAELVLPAVRNPKATALRSKFP